MTANLAPQASAVEADEVDGIPFRERSSDGQAQEQDIGCEH